MNAYADWLGRMPTEEDGYLAWQAEGRDSGWLDSGEPPEAPPSNGSDGWTFATAQTEAADDAHGNSPALITETPRVSTRAGSGAV